MVQCTQTMCTGVSKLVATSFGDRTSSTGPVASHDQRAIDLFRNSVVELTMFVRKNIFETIPLQLNATSDGKVDQTFRIKFGADTVSQPCCRLSLCFRANGACPLVPFARRFGVLRTQHDLTAVCSGLATGRRRFGVLRCVGKCAAARQNRAFGSVPRALQGNWFARGRVPRAVLRSALG